MIAYTTILNNFDIFISLYSNIFIQNTKSDNKQTGLNFICAFSLFFSTKLSMLVKLSYFIKFKTLFCLFAIIFKV